MTQKRPTSGAPASEHPARTPQQKTVDAFIDLDEVLTRENRAPDSRSPGEHTVAEACAVRILVKHYGWVVTEPGVIRRHRK